MRQMAYWDRESAVIRERLGVRLAELVGSLSLATDLGNGQPLETTLSCTLVALGLARASGLSPADWGAVYWAGLLRFIGCTSTSVEESGFGGDDLELRAALVPADFLDGADLEPRLVQGLGRGLPASQRAEAVRSFLRRGPQIAPAVLTSHCEVAVRLASRLGMPAGVLAALDAYHERWDGYGPKGLRMEAIPPAARVLSVAQVAVSNARALTTDELQTLLRRRAGGQLDPGLVSTFLRGQGELLGMIDGASAWDAVIEGEPGAPRWVPAEQVVEVARVLGDYSDLKSPFTLGHARGVARLVVDAAGLLGLSPSDSARVESAALLHDLGRVSVPNGILDKPGPLNAVERDRVRGHARYTESIFAVAPAVAGLGRLAASNHERLDGSGYPHGFSGAALGPETRLLAAADWYQGMIEERAYRPAYTRGQAAERLRVEAKRGRFDARAVAAVLEAAGQGAASARHANAWPAELTDREVEVLRLVARGLTNKEVASCLGISPRTVQQHTLHIYDKIGVSTRAAATLFATEHNLSAIWT